MAVLNFRSTSYLKAFTLYAVVAAIAAALAVEVRMKLEDKNSGFFKFMDPLTPEPGVSAINKILITIIMTFIIYIIIDNLMYFIFGWGGGMLVAKRVKQRKYV